MSSSVRISEAIRRTCVFRFVTGANWKRVRQASSIQLNSELSFNASMELITTNGGGGLEFQAGY